MPVTTVTFAQSFILIALGAWAYLSSETPSVTALIPVFIGSIIAVLSFLLMKNDNSKKLTWSLVSFNILTVLIMCVPLIRNFVKDDVSIMAVSRVSIMIAVSVFALVILFGHLKRIKQDLNVTE